MQFISDRESLAEEFAFQTQNESSYLLSSRASRRRILYEDGVDPAEEEIEDFKEEIEQKFNESVINKIYTFPFKYYSIEMFDDSEFKDLEGQIEISLYNEEESSESRNNKFKVFNKKIKNEKVSNLLLKIKAQKENFLAMNFYNEDSLCESNETKPTNNPSVRKSKGRQTGDKSGQIKIIHETINSREESPNGKIRLHTEPYEKPLGYILKKK